MSFLFSEVWENAVSEIKRDLYKSNNKRKSIGHRLTAYEPYNQAYIEQKGKKDKEWLFASYEQMENKN